MVLNTACMKNQKRENLLAGKIIALLLGLKNIFQGFRQHVCSSRTVLLMPTPVLRPLLEAKNFIEVLQSYTKYPPRHTYLWIYFVQLSTKGFSHVRENARERSTTFFLALGSCYAEIAEKVFWYYFPDNINSSFCPNYRFHYVNQGCNRLFSFTTGLGY